MPDPVTILTTLAYAICANAGVDKAAHPIADKALDLLSQLFGGAAGNAFHGNLESLHAAFLHITLPDKNRDLDHAVARSALQANY